MERDRAVAWPAHRPVPENHRSSVQTCLDALSRWQQRHGLLLFLVLGLVLFLADGLLAGRTPLAVPAAVQADSAAAAQWLEDEVLYREALARGLGEGDLIIRRRLVQKMRLLLETGVDAPEPAGAELREWIEQHPGRYGGIARVRLEHVFVSRSRHGADMGTFAGTVRARLDAGTADLEALSDPHPGGTHLDGVDSRGLERMFGTLLAERIAELAPGQWHGPLPSSLGLHFVRVQARETREVNEAAVVDRARRDWLIEQRRQGARQALDDLLRQYDLRGTAAP